MRWTAVIGLGLLAPLAGCNLVHYAGHNLVREPVDRANDEKLSHRLKREARFAWQEVRRRCPTRTFSHAFADGFQDGYADHLDNGGPPLPPAVPPPRYRSHPNDFTPAGHAAARDYLIGFQYGAEVACSSGRREFLTVPVLLPNEPPAEKSIQLVKFPDPPEVPGAAPFVPMPPPRNPSSLPQTSPPKAGLAVPLPRITGGPSRPESTPVPQAPSPAPLPVPLPTPTPLPSGPLPSAGIPQARIPVPPVGLPGPWESPPRPISVPEVPVVRVAGTQPAAGVGEASPRKSVPLIPPVFEAPPPIAPVFEAPPPLPPAPSPR